MREWWLGANEAIVQGGLSRSSLRLIVADTLQKHAGCSVLRPGAKDLFAVCRYSGIPLTIYSAGIADVIEEIVLQDTGCDLTTMRESDAVVVVANRALWREDGIIAGFAAPLVHGMNKCELDVTDAVHRQIRSPARLLLLGDSISDAHMADPIIEASNTGDDAVVLRIAWIGGDGEDEPDEAKIADFLHEFDAVVTGDGPLTAALEILADVTATHQI